MKFNVYKQLSFFQEKITFLAPKAAFFSLFKEFFKSPFFPETQQKFTHLLNFLLENTLML